ncbi:MAG: hypothetical protein PHV82_17650 [Victivallaceae bacterium]|nr:hypothetical protein [Victivallaceae bacterium]
MGSIKGFFMRIGQILKKIIIAAIVAGVLYAGYLVWVKFIRQTQKHTKSAAVTRAVKQGVITKK